VRFSLTSLAAAALSATLLAGAPPAAHSAPPPQLPLKDFFHHPERAYFRLSDDGKTLGFMQPVAQADGTRRLNVFVQPLKGSAPVGEPRKLTSETARDIGTYYWKGSDTILYEKDFGGDENTHVVAVDVASGKITDLTPGDKVRAGIIDDLRDDPQHILIQHNRRNPQVFDVYRVELRTGKATLVAENPGDIVGWQTDHAGRVRAAVRSQGLNTMLLYRPDEKSEFKTLVTTDYKTEVDPAFFTPDDRKLYAISNRGRDKKALVVIDPDEPDAEEVLFEHPQVDVAGAASALPPSCRAISSTCKARRAPRTSSSSPPAATARRARATSTTWRRTASPSSATSTRRSPRRRWRRCGRSTTRAATA